MKSIAKINHYYLTIILIIFTLAAFLRFSYLSDYPLGANPDELSNIYDGYSISKTGADRWGQKYPTILRGLGENDNRPPMYAWLVASSMKVFGKSITAGRFPAAFIGILSIILLFFVAKRIGGQLFGLIAIFFAAISPWHIFYSRYGLEGTTLPSFFIILSLFLWQKYKETDQKLFYIILLGFCNGLATNAYQATKVIFLLLSILIVFDVFWTEKNKIKATFFLGIATIIGALPQIYTLIALPDRFFARIKGTVNTEISNIDFLKSLFLNFYQNLKPGYLFLSFGKYNYFTFGRLLKIEALFFYLGVVVFIYVFRKYKPIKPVYFLIITFICLLPSAITTDNPNAIRTSAVVILYPIFTASGVYFIYQFIKNRNLKIIFFAVIFLFSLQISFSNHKEYTNSIPMRDAGQQTIFVKAFEKLNNYQNKYPKIYIYTPRSQGYLYLAFFTNIEPEIFQKLPKTRMPGGWDYIRRVGKYYFINENELQKITENNISNAMLMSQIKNDKLSLIDSVRFESESFYFYKSPKAL